MKAGEGVAFCPPMGGGGGGGVGRDKDGEQTLPLPTPWPDSFFSSLNEGIRQPLSVRTHLIWDG